MQSYDAELESRDRDPSRMKRSRLLISPAAASENRLL